MRENHNVTVERRGFLQATGATGAAVALGGVAKADPTDGPSNELIATYPASVPSQEARAELPDHVSILYHDPELRMFVLEVDEEEGLYSTSSTAASIGSSSKFKSVEDNHEIHALSVDEGSSQGLAEVTESLAVDDPKLSDQYAPQLVDAPDAWEDERGSDGVTVAVVDQGVQYDHPDLESRFGSNKGKDFVDDDDDPAPANSDEHHGTHVAGIAAATTDNGTGIAGVSNSRLLSCRALNARGRGSVGTVAPAIRWAADQGADLINMSLGFARFSDTIKNALTYALNNGAVPVAAAGNSGSRGVAYPAGHDECVAVSAVDSNDDLASFSQYGESVEVAAPGVQVLSTVPDDSYQKLSGTSMACPAAVGVAALGLAAAGGDLSAGQLRQRLKDTADDVGLSDDEQGAGRVNAANIVDPGGSEVSFEVSDLRAPDSATKGDEITVGALIANVGDAEGTTTAEFRVDTNGDDELGGDETLASQEVSLEAGGETKASFDVDTSALESGTYRHGVVAGDDRQTAEIRIESGSEASFDVSDLEAPAKAKAGDEITVSATVANTGDAEGATTVEFRVDTNGDDDLGGDETLASQDVSLDAGGETGVSFDVDTSPLEPGEYRHGVVAGAGEATAEIVVEDGDGGGGDDPCESPSETVTKEGELAEVRDEDVYSYTLGMDDPCSLRVALEGPSDADFDLYLTRDVREPTPDDYDRRSFGRGSDESILLLEGLEKGAEVGVLVISYAGSGSYTLEIEETGREKAEAEFEVSDLRAPDSATKGDEITVGALIANVGDAEGTTTAEFRVDTNGDDELGEDETLLTEAVSLEAGGETKVSFDVDTSPLEPGTYRHGVAAGEGRATATIRIRGDSGGSCGDATNTATETSRSEDYLDPEVYSYTLQTTGPCSASLDLQGEGYQFLFVTLDGRTPTFGDYDRRASAIRSGTASITIEEDLEKGQELGILVLPIPAYEGHRLDIEEVGKGGGGGDGDGGDDGDPDTCGEVTESSSAEGALRYPGQYDRYRYTMETPDPCQVTVQTTGPDDADFELYARSGDEGWRSEGPTSDETISITDPPGGDGELQVFVYSRTGTGSYEVSIEEVGKR